MPGCEEMASCWTDCVIRQAIVEAANSLGYATIRELQAKVITSIVAGKDVFLSLPTGTGESLCFALVPLVFDCLFGYERGTKTSLEPRLSFVGGKESLEHTVCACAKIPRNPGNSDSSVKYHVYYSVY